MGADYYMLKPFDMHLLAERIWQFAKDDEQLTTPRARRRSPWQSRSSRRLPDLQAIITELLHEWDAC